MTVTFFSNYLNHYQISFSDAMYGILGDGYTFVETEPMDEERLKLGWGFDADAYPYLLRSYKNAETLKKSYELAENSDIIIIGSAPEEYVAARLKLGKLTFRYSERLFKRGFWRLLDPRVLRGNFRYHIRYRNEKNLHMLCASSYTAYDCSRIFSYPGRMYKWGYFPETKNYDLDELFEKKKHPQAKILWAGRFLDWKHPEAAVSVARYLSGKNIDFRMDFIGNGAELDKTRNLAAMYNDKVKFHGSMEPEKVREHMESADIFLFTSDFQEGWGVVLGEAMNSACAVVASHAVGAARFLVKSGENGYIYKNGRTSELCGRVEHLVKNPSERKKLGTAAYKTMTEVWSPQNAAKQAVALFEALLGGKRVDFEDGPCSGAEF